MDKLIAFAFGFGACMYIGKIKARIKELEMQVALAKKEEPKNESGE